MPSKFEMEASLALTESERRENRRFDAYFAFEMAPLPSDDDPEREETS